MLLLLDNRSGGPGGEKKLAHQSMPIGMGPSLADWPVVRSPVVRDLNWAWDFRSHVRLLSGCFQSKAKAALSPAGQGHSLCHIEMLFLSSMTIPRCCGV